MRKLWKFVFSRYFISGIMICLEIALMTMLILNASTYSYITVAIVALLDIIALASIINRDANPEYKVSWVTVVLLCPVVGAILYFLFFTRRMTRKEIRLLSGAFSQINALRSDEKTLLLLAKENTLAAGKAYAISNDDAISELYRGTSSRHFPSGEEMFRSMISDLEGAKEFIFLEYFIIEKGKLWDKIHETLKRKVSEGVEIRLLYDDIGCMKTLPQDYEYVLRSEGIRAYRFGRVSPRMSSVHNNRDHRKICIIDGKIGYTGGVNIADEYVNEKLRFGHWKDGGISLYGSAVAGLTKQFLSLWDYTSNSISYYDVYVEKATASEDADGGYYMPFGSGPAPIYKRPVGKNAFLNIINQSQRYLYITTPYLIIDYELSESLCNAALRGVDVRIITPGIADKKKIKVMTKSSYPHLMSAGIKIYEYTPGFIHEKTLISDDEYAVIGTINFDYRSLVHHFENAVWIYNSRTVTDARDGFIHTLEKSARVDEATSKLTFKEWIVRNGIKLFAPLL